ncbi:MAG TPA: hypothetical protein VIK61_18780 [Acidimicrobiia bacterium]
MPTLAPEPDPARVRSISRIVTRGLAIVAVALALGSVGLYFAVRAPTGSLNRFLFDLRGRRDAHAWTQLCRADQREVSQADFVAAWHAQRAKYGAVIDTIDAFTFEPFGTTRHLHYRLSFRDDKVQANTYPVDVVRENGQWKVCGFFRLSRNPDKPGPLSGFENW